MVFYAHVLTRVLSGWRGRVGPLRPPASLQNALGLRGCTTPKRSDRYLSSEESCSAWHPEAPQQLDQTPLFGQFFSNGNLFTLGESTEPG